MMHVVCCYGVCVYLRHMLTASACRYTLSYTLNLKCTMSPSCIMYCLPSWDILPAALQPSSPPEGQTV